MTDFLRDMAHSSAERAASADAVHANELDGPLVPLSLDGFNVIAEIKQRSPAEGALAAADSDRIAQAERYAAGGAVAISVLTEPSRFDGSLAHLKEVAAARPDVPVMRKDFLVDPIQLLEARRDGASGVLLITAMLDDDQLRSMLDCAFEHGLFVLLEAFDEDDLARSKQLRSSDFDRAAAGQLLFGLNTRNLRSLKVDPDRLERLATSMPDGYRVAESGLKTASDAARMAGFGYQLALVGTALMRSDDPAQLIRDMRTQGSEVLAAC
jgi:indole-3-glycerol phosphate synthase